MKKTIAAIALLSFVSVSFAADLNFRMQEIDATLKVGYGVVIADVNGDGKPDIVVADANRVVWYENPTWKRRTMIEGAVPPDIVCIAPCDIEGKKEVCFFIGADWHADDPTKGGSIHWMRRGKTLDDPWEVFKIGEEPAVHRMALWERGVAVVPLMGQDATKEKKWLDGRSVPIRYFRIPENPTLSSWDSEVLEDSLHLVHGVSVIDWGGLRGTSLVTASAEGISEKRFSRCGNDLPPQIVRIMEKDKTTALATRGAGEINTGHFADQTRFLATIEPRLGNQLVVYPSEESWPPGFDEPLGHVKWTCILLDDKMIGGRTLSCADLDNEGTDWIIAGIRDDLSKTPDERRGVRIYKSGLNNRIKWHRQIVDDGGIACEDLTVADLNGDGKPEIIATGRQTGNVRIYWNEGRK